MFYTIGEMGKKIGVAPSTLRYYDKMGLLPFVERSKAGTRVFKDSDYEWLNVIECLKKTGMELKDIKKLVEMAMDGDKTIEPRLELITKQKNAVSQQINELQETLKTLEFKEWYYLTAKEMGTTDALKNMPLEELPEEFREVRLNLRGE